MTKVLIAEDDLLIADMLQEVLVDDGYEVCGIARTVDEAITIGRRERPDFAVLDLRLAAGGLGTEIAHRLDRGAMSVLYATGNAGQIKLTREDGDACISKPYRSSDILRAMKIVEGMARGGTASGPFPRGFSLLPASANDAGPAGVMPMAEPALARALRQQSVLAKFGTFALRETDLDDVLGEGVRVCAAGLDVAFCNVSRFRVKEDDFVVAAAIGWRADVAGRVVCHAGENTPEGRAFATTSPVVCTDLRTDLRFLLPSFYGEHGAASSLHVVIKRTQGQPWGILGIADPNVRAFGEHDVDFLTGVANILAQAVNTAQRDEVARAAFERMRDMVADRDRLLGSQARLITEREVLTQELQHRVRNNLQLVYSMLRTPVGMENNGEFVGEIRAIARRVMTLSNVYDHLLGRDVEREIDFGGYLQTICLGFRDVEDPEPRGVVLTCDARRLMLDLDTSTALGLVMAELVSNSYRHAFPDGRGRIDVSLPTVGTADEAVIVFSDDGIGYGPSCAKRRGLGLVSRLMEQVGGSARVVSDRGTIWTLRFPVGVAMSRAA